MVDLFGEEISEAEYLQEVKRKPLTLRRLKHYRDAETDGVSRATCRNGKGVLMQDHRGERRVTRCDIFITASAHKVCDMWR